LIRVAVEAIASTVGALVAAALLSWLLWYALRLVSHPELGAVAVLMLVGLALLGILLEGRFMKLTLMFSVIAAVPLWIAGRAWHRRSLLNPNGTLEQGAVLDHDAPVAPGPSSPSLNVYPAISACIRENRSPTRDEVHVAAARLWREGLAQRFGSPLLAVSFAARRVVLRTARAALTGGGEQKPRQTGHSRERNSMMN
jgi:hypothetical protein